MSLQRQTIEQRGHRRPHRRPLGYRRLVPLSLVVWKDACHLPAGAEELDLLALDQGGVFACLFQHNSDRVYWQMYKKRMIGNLLDDCFGNDAALPASDERGYSVTSSLLQPRRLSTPELDLTRDLYLTMLDPLVPVLKHTRLEQPIPDAPRARVT